MARAVYFQWLATYPLSSPWLATIQIKELGRREIPSSFLRPGKSLAVKAFAASARHHVRVLCIVGLRYFGTTRLSCDVRAMRTSIACLSSAISPACFSIARCCL